MNATILRDTGFRAIGQLGGGFGAIGRLGASVNDDPFEALSLALGETLAKPSGKVVALSTNMTYQQRLDYARGGFWAMQVYHVTGLPADLEYEVTSAIAAYFAAAKMIEQNGTTFVTDQLNALSRADAYADRAITHYRQVGPTSSSSAIAKAAAKLPKASSGPVTAQVLSDAQNGFPGGTLGKVVAGGALGFLGVLAVRAFTRK